MAGVKVLEQEQDALRPLGNVWGYMENLQLLETLLYQAFKGFLYNGYLICINKLID